MSGAAKTFGTHLRRLWSRKPAIRPPSRADELDRLIDQACARLRARGLHPSILRIEDADVGPHFARRSQGKLVFPASYSKIRFVGPSAVGGMPSKIGKYQFVCPVWEPLRPEGASMSVAERAACVPDLGRAWL